MSHIFSPFLSLHFLSNTGKKMFKRMAIFSFLETNSLDSRQIEIVCMTSVLWSFMWRTVWNQSSLTKNHMFLQFIPDAFLIRTRTCGMLSKKLHRNSLAQFSTVLACTVNTAGLNMQTWARFQSFRTVFHASLQHQVYSCVSWTLSWFSCSC